MRSNEVRSIWHAGPPTGSNERRVVPNQGIVVTMMMNLLTGDGVLPLAG